MLSLELARSLRDAGLIWKPADRDLFALLDRQMDNQVFVINEFAVLIQSYNGYPVVAFHGTPEWALDYVLIDEVVWMPSESQLRDMIAEHLTPDAILSLSRTTEGYRCDIDYIDRVHEFSAAEAEDAYGQALLYILETSERR